MEGGRWGRKTNAPVSIPNSRTALALPYFMAPGGWCARGAITQCRGLGLWLPSGSGRETRTGGGGHGYDAWAPTGLRRVMLRAHRQAWCWQDEWTELSMADIRALEEETARMLAQRMAKCNSGSEGPEAQAPGKPSVEARAAASHAGTPDGPEAPSGPDASPDASFGKQWSSSSRSSYSSQHGGEAGAQGREGAALRLDAQAEVGVALQGACLPRACLSGACRTSPETQRTAPRRSSLMPTVSTTALLGVEVSLSSSHCPMIQPLVLSEGFSDSDEVFPKEMTKWNSNDFIDAFASPVEAEGTPGKDCQPPAPYVQSTLRETLSPKLNGVLNRMSIRGGCSLNTQTNGEWIRDG